MTERLRFIDPHAIVPQWCASAVDPALCTAIIAAAGRGSRLGSDQPKILFPIAGMSTLERLESVLRPFCERLVLVVSPAGRAAVTATADRICAGRYTTAEQSQPTGMFDAVGCGLPAVTTPHTLVVWGDQAGIRAESLRVCFSLHYGPLAPGATLPTLMCERPYIHFERNEEGAITRVLQAREGDPMPERGESDCGVFLFRTAALRAAMERSECSMGAQSGERNFLPVLPSMEATSSVLCVRTATPIEAVGVNSPADAERLARHFRVQALEVNA